VGSALAHALCAAGHDVTAVTRHPERYHGAGRPAGADIRDREAIQRVLAGHEVAYFLVHSLTDVGFAAEDRAAARTFASAATRAGVAQVVYLGGLGDDDDDLSEHLRSRREVESILLNGAPTTALRAGIVIGDGGISWEILRQLVERLPAMVTPRWVDTRSQPIALVDAVSYLTGVLGRDDAVAHTYEIGGPDILSYREMMETVAQITGRRRIILPVPLLSPRLSSHWLRLVTDVDLATARALVDSLTNEVIVHDHGIDALLPHKPLSFATAAVQALEVRAERQRMRGAVPADR
jgi:uncharacterized protein YbjT (DUF2867 family)